MHLLLVADDQLFLLFSVEHHQRALVGADHEPRPSGVCCQRGHQFVELEGLQHLAFFRLEDRDGLLYAYGELALAHQRKG